jgi:enoyl-CoA hydratase/carnithine racemase
MSTEPGPPDRPVARAATKGATLTLTLSDPARRNALGPELMESLLDELDLFSANSDLRVLVLTGDGSAFCSGANVQNMAARIDEARRESGPPKRRARDPWTELDPQFSTRMGGDARLGPEVVRRLQTLRKPSIAAVNGPAYGLGCGLALSCDIRIAGDSARFSEAFVRNGLVPGDGSTWQLPKLIGLGNALWMAYTGEVVSADEALRIGLVQRVVPDSELMESAQAMAEQLADGPIFTMGMIKQLMLQSFGQDLPSQLLLASRAQDIARAGAEHAEGVRAFLERRKPDFRALSSWAGAPDSTDEDTDANP